GGHHRRRSAHQGAGPGTDPRVACLHPRHLPGGAGLPGPAPPAAHAAGLAGRAGDRPCHQRTLTRCSGRTGRTVTVTQDDHQSDAHGQDQPAATAPPEDFRAGFVCVVGRPNAGKSTLTNALVGQKVAITSGRPQTTRHAIRGIVHRPDVQLILVDTPGVHRPRTLLGARLNELVTGTLSEVDAIALCLPADQKIGPGDRFVAATVAESRTPVVALATKADTVSKERLAEHLLAIADLGDWADIV